MTTFKLYFKEDDIRRVTLEVPDYDNFMRELVELYPDQFHPELRVCYKDEEGDMITISTQKEWALMMETEKASIKKLYISEGNNSGRYFKDGPPPEPLSLYTSEGGETKDVEDETMKKLEFAVPKCLERLLPGGKLTPYNLPEWLSGCVQVKRLPGADLVVDLDIDVLSLFNTLHRQALALITPESSPQLLKRAKDLLQSMIDLAPDNPLPHYNLACAESLLGELKEAVASLKRAVETGYTNVSHMLQDTDLNNLHPLPEFRVLVDDLRKRLQPEEKKPEPVPEVKKEEVKEENKPEPVPEVKEEKKEEKKPEPVPEVKEEKKEEKPKKWATQLEALAAMGFDNQDVNAVLLDDFKGDLMKVVNALLYGNQ